MGSKKEENDKKADVEMGVESEDEGKVQKSGMDKNFHKIYIYYFIKYLDGIMNKKMKLVLWLVKNMTITNELKFSYREIAEKSGISYQTVAETMKTLMENDFIRRANEKTIMVNPRAVFRGRLDKKMGVLNVYYRLDQGAIPKNKRKSVPSIADTKVLNKELRELEEKKKRLQKEIDSLELQLLFTDKEEQKDGEEDKDSTTQTS